MFGLLTSVAKRMFDAREKQRRSPIKCHLQFRPTLEQLDQRVLPSLTPIYGNVGYPFTAVCEVQVTFPNHETFVGSGAMIDSFHLLTAGHMLYEPSDGGWATSIRVTPDMQDSSTPYGTVSGTYERVDASWIAHPTPGGASVDIGLVTLNTAIGNRTGWFGLGYNSNNNFFANHYFATAGFPADQALGYNGREMYYSFGKLTGEEGDDLVSTEGQITNVPGQSGSPLWNTSNDWIYGVNSAWNGNTAAGTQDYFTRITQSVYNELQSWRQADHLPSSARAIVTNAFAEVNTGLSSGAFTGDALPDSNSAKVTSLTDAINAVLPGAPHKRDTAVAGKGRIAVVDTVFAKTDDFDALRHSNL